MGFKVVLMLLKMDYYNVLSQNLVVKSRLNILKRLYREPEMFSFYNKTYA